ncbi:ribosomal-protein-alanine acetyltransferase, partial [Elioraea sp. Yellowstone]|uniref:GNAT family N-acetyltransferase n=1 Tax=Elioraea sp. Yellowstone TaxID=2592070 RepID=UPI00116A8DFB
AAAAAEAQARGAGRLFLEVAVGNAAARRLYGRLGFREVGQRRGYYPDGADALVLALALSPPS